MKYFLELIETIQKDGYSMFINADTGPPVRHKSTALNSGLFEAFERCQPFVLSLKEEQAIDVFSSMPDSQEEAFGLNFTLLSPPFSVFSLEMPTYPLLVMSGFKYFYPDIVFGVRCIMCREFAPGEWGYYVYMRSQDNSIGAVVVSEKFGLLVEKYLSYFSKSKIGNEKIRARIKLGIGKDKRTYTFRNVIHVVPKSTYPEFESKNTRLIDWKYRWSCRGHWREHPGKIGKDRDGNYCVQNFTWVNDHIKGPEHMPLITKQRVVDLDQ